MPKNLNPPLLPQINPADQEAQICRFIKSTFQKAHKQTATVAVSGGIDSAVTLTLTAKALNPRSVQVFTLPAKGTQHSHTQDAKDLGTHLGILEKNIHEVNLAASQDGLEKTLRLFTPNSETLDNIRLGNIAARLRMIILFDQARALDALVVGTENKSEHLLAYYTRFGDEASDLEPIKHLYKTQIYDLAQFLLIPRVFLDRPPTAGLWSDQTDEAELGFSYTQADPILHHHFDLGHSKTNLLKLGFDPKLVNKVLHHLNRVAFKHHVPYQLESNSTTTTSPSALR